MVVHLLRDMERIRKGLLEIGGRVETAVDDAIRALLDGDAERARRVIQGDQVIDEEEVEFEEMCLRSLALHQPVATDLRFIIAALKVNNDLERIGDLAANISERVLHFEGARVPKLTSVIEKMGNTVRRMVSQSLRSLLEQDRSLALAVCQDDDSVDAFHRDMFALVQQEISADVDVMSDAISVLSVSRHLERIADLATNIAEDLIFLIDGKIVRHASEGEVD